MHSLHVASEGVARALGSKVVIVFNLANLDQLEDVVLRGVVKRVIATELWGPNQSLIVSLSEGVTLEGQGNTKSVTKHLLAIGAGMNPVTELFGVPTRPSGLPVQVAIWRVPHATASNVTEMPPAQGFLGRAEIYLDGSGFSSPLEARSRAFETCVRLLTGRRIRVGIAEPTDFTDFGRGELTGNIRQILFVKRKTSGSFFVAIMELDRPMPFRGGTKVLSLVARNVGAEISDLLTKDWIVVNFSAEPERALIQPEEDPDLRLRRATGYLGFGLASLV